MNIKLNKDQKIRVYNASDIYNIMREILLLEEENDRNKEHFWTIGLDSGQVVLNIELVSLGTASETLVEPMEVYSIPLQKKASKLILVHNHPSGIVMPSPKDEEMTDRLIQVGLLMNVPVIDHLIITENSYYSFQESGLLANLAKSTKYVPSFVLKQQYEKAGKQKGAEEGAKAKAKEMAKAMLAKDYAIEEIMELTGLSKAVISRMKN